MTFVTYLLILVQNKIYCEYLSVQFHAMPQARDRLGLDQSNVRVPPGVDS